METKVLSKLVKPSFPTPPTLQNYKISYIDEFAPNVYVPFILYYPPPPKPQQPNISNQLEFSLSKTLTHFYPFPGRFKRQDALVDCSDQGVEYVQGKTNFQLSEILHLKGDLIANVVDQFLPREMGEAVEADAPMLSIKVTTFECGSLAIGMCFHHKLADMSTVCTFINHWATTNQEEKREPEKHLQFFSVTDSFPCKGFPETKFRVGANNATRRFLFKGNVIAALREKIGSVKNGRRSPSKVQLVVALLWKTLVCIDQEKYGQSKASFLIQPVNLRDKVVPPLPENSCGNIWVVSTSRLGPGEGDSINFEGYFELLRSSIKKAATDCAKLIAHGEEGSMVLVNPILEAKKTIACGDHVNTCFFTSWCNFSYYKADFGWGKPVWASPGKLPFVDFGFMLDDQEGDGVEAWVNLDQKCMAELEQDSEFRATIY